MAHLSRRVRATRLRVAGGSSPATAMARREERLVVEAPLQVRVTVPGQALLPVATTMRTPGHDLDLAVGLLVAGGTVRSPDDVVSATLLETDEVGSGVEVRLAAHVDPPVGTGRGLPVTGTGPVVGPAGDPAGGVACGVRDPGDVAALAAAPRHDLAADARPVDPATLLALPGRLARRRRGTALVAGAPAAGLFGPAGGGDPSPLVLVREDADRRHAVDKVVGWSLRHRLVPLLGHLLLVAGGASFDLVQRAWLAGSPVLVTTAPPTSAAVDLAERAGMTLVALTGEERLTVYAGAGRVAG